MAGTPVSRIALGYGCARVDDAMEMGFGSLLT
jgi:hypothetical protein